MPEQGNSSYKTSRLYLEPLDAGHADMPREHVSLRLRVPPPEACSGLHGSVLDEDPGGYRYFAPLSQMVGKQQ